MRTSESAPGVGGGINDLFTFGAIPSSPYRCADGDQYSCECRVYIIRASVQINLVMDELCRQKDRSYVMTLSSRSLQSKFGLGGFGRAAITRPT